MRKELKEIAARRNAELSELATSGYYKNVRKAEQYVENKLAAPWRFILHLTRDDEPICDKLELSPTMIKLVHLFGRTAHNHGNDRAKPPMVKTWMPTFDAAANGGDGAMTVPRAFTKRELSRVIGASLGAVHDAVQAFRGTKPSGRARHEVHERFFSERIVFPNVGEVGVSLDITVAAQCVFPFMRSDYEYFNRYAIDMKLNDAECNRRQIEWSREAIRSKGDEPGADAEVVDIKPNAPSASGATMNDAEE